MLMAFSFDSEKCHLGLEHGVQFQNSEVFSFESEIFYEIPLGKIGTEQKPFSQGVVQFHRGFRDRGRRVYIGAFESIMNVSAVQILCESTLTFSVF